RLRAQIGELEFPLAGDKTAPRAEMDSKRLITARRARSGELAASGHYLPPAAGSAGPRRRGTRHAMTCWSAVCPTIPPSPPSPPSPAYPTSPALALLGRYLAFPI